MSSTAPQVAAAETGAMLRALELAGLGVRGANPLVGAVLLAPDGTVLGEGYHRGAGTPHAEPAALADARERGHDARGATMVVTLEPCNHTGRTGPCSEALLDAGVARVVFAAEDVNGSASGGARRLRAAGVEAVGGVGREASLELNERWSVSVAERRPFVTLKSAQSLDGRVAAVDGTSQWITGAEARADGHRLRAIADAVLVGSGTVRDDDPRLTVRAGAAAPVSGMALRVAMGLTPVPAGAAIRGEGFIHLPTRDVGAALDQLVERGVRHLLVEGGPRIAGAFLRAGVVDELVSYVAPLVLGEGAPAFPGLGIGTLAAAPRWVLDDAGGPAVQRLGTDVRLHLRPPPGVPAASHH
ncbi:bifunctional diaminohydroxyphosphoribosylaminopyrimidine deaminase/5-amino-6-(5-phosphoribosylamino)uracil reductase RibD [Arthrobacter agilis]|uniref:bifunctional diaminohydroxyphosphoribosylaminopyrimidine deaminase/5-amino-6-(5-phosphoribosylamino)uracil reductase RibD n=1 Tax=Arthrobacter agilis TaxID=37921 RepID=UPI000B352743|nr:bifunctional diaminohydroxyphosphoribosylaminopyrimidine deaminase/5-amino-6-(5-phosphoribosylamino)uracil reductase RibD [Arthrobacter agilis]OUM44582.1 riboflavin biosynthesis protein RibD [Arthrobacter agilis]PPB47565.1 bifunctional diaminohydroxyphosphoribosylaminopyrimidine deaminase/5-amino-6-(5-phosphoribosylamino)uracil reductase RibD [Arthrobacter agilis]TPV22724.1 bifunctional diaminohydroxyphosphoribosylaminopyrimidine deaminase/5-amino-6-(5-phosphoribosylamino)uracil reductase Rib